MRSDQIAPASGRPRSPASGFEDADLAGVRATCRRQALKAENAGLRAADERLSGQERLRTRAEPRMDDGELASVVIPLGVRAPGVARSVVARCLADNVGPSMLETMLLLVSELVTNSVRHSGLPEGECWGVVRATQGPTRVWAQLPCPALA